MIKKLLKIIDNKYKVHYFILFLAFFPVTFLETIGIGSIPAFVLLISQPDNLNSYISSKELISFLSNLTLYERAIYGSIIIGLIFLIKSIDFPGRAIRTRSPASSRQSLIENRCFCISSVSPRLAKLTKV